MIVNWTEPREGNWSPYPRGFYSSEPANVEPGHKFDLTVEGYDEFGPSFLLDSISQGYLIGLRSLS